MLNDAQMYAALEAMDFWLLLDWVEDGDDTEYCFWSDGPSPLHYCGSRLFWDTPEQSKAYGWGQAQKRYGG